MTSTTNQMNGISSVLPPPPPQPPTNQQPQDPQQLGESLSSLNTSVHSNAGGSHAMAPAPATTTNTTPTTINTSNSGGNTMSQMRGHHHARSSSASSYDGVSLGSWGGATTATSVMYDPATGTYNCKQHGPVASEQCSACEHEIQQQTLLLQQRRAGLQQQLNSMPEALNDLKLHFQNQQQQQTHVAHQQQQMPAMQHIPLHQQQPMHQTPMHQQQHVQQQMPLHQLNYTPQQPQQTYVPQQQPQQQGSHSQQSQGSSSGGGGINGSQYTPPPHFAPPVSANPSMPPLPPHSHNGNGSSMNHHLSNTNNTNNNTNDSHHASALHQQISRMQQMQDWMLLQKEQECGRLRTQLAASQQAQQDLAVQNAQLREKLHQQHERMQHELQLIKLAAKAQQQQQRSKQQQQLQMQQQQQQRALVVSTHSPKSRNHLDPYQQRSGGDRSNANNKNNYDQMIQPQSDLYDDGDGDIEDDDETQDTESVHVVDKNHRRQSSNEKAESMDRLRAHQLRQSDNISPLSSPFPKIATNDSIQEPAWTLHAPADEVVDAAPSEQDHHHVSTTTATPSVPKHLVVDAEQQHVPLEETISIGTMPHNKSILHNNTANNNSNSTNSKSSDSGNKQNFTFEPMENEQQQAEQEHTDDSVYHDNVIEKDIEGEKSRDVQYKDVIGGFATTLASEEILSAQASPSQVYENFGRYNTEDKASNSGGRDVVNEINALPVASTAEEKKIEVEKAFHPVVPKFAYDVISEQQVTAPEVTTTDDEIDTWSYVGPQIDEDEKGKSATATTKKQMLPPKPPTSNPPAAAKGVSWTDDNASAAQSVASSTFGEDRLRVTASSILDPYGDKGLFTGIILRSTGMPHGSGRMVYQEDKRTYEGHWRHGRWHGAGRATFANGDKYVGEYRFDQRHGQGRYEWNDGRVYDGMFREDKRHGHGKFMWPDGAEYEGEFRNGQREGKGVYKFSDGGRYEGSWKDGRYSGYGVCAWEDGRCYKGEWLNGMAHGRGVETFPDGSIRHDGQWVEDEPV